MQAQWFFAGPLRYAVRLCAGVPLPHGAGVRTGVLPHRVGIRTGLLLYAVGVRAGLLLYAVGVRAGLLLYAVGVRAGLLLDVRVWNAVLWRWSKSVVRGRATSANDVF